MCGSGKYCDDKLEEVKFEITGEINKSCKIKLSGDAGATGFQCSPAF